MMLLETQIGCLTPELSELKKQYESVSDLFNTKKSVLQDHFSKLLNGEYRILPVSGTLRLNKYSRNES